MQICENISDISIEGLLERAKHLIATQNGLTFQAPALEARILFTFVTGKTHTWIITHAKSDAKSLLGEHALGQFTTVVNQRLSGTPIAFIIGSQDFWSLTLKVSNFTLIPRQDTEIIVETTLDLVLPPQAKVLDLGTGTGAIALALAKERPNWDVLGVDNITEAVELAKENSRINNVPARFLHSDWFMALDTNNGDGASNKFDVIVSNPPYVESDSDYVTQGDLRFEPLSALVSGEDGLNDIRHIIQQAPRYLTNNGYLLIEHGNTQQKSVHLLLEDAGFVEVRSVADINHIQRITLGKLVAV